MWPISRFPESDISGTFIKAPLLQGAVTQWELALEFHYTKQTISTLQLGVGIAVEHAGKLYQFGSQRQYFSTPGEKLV